MNDSQPHSSMEQNGQSQFGATAPNLTNDLWQQIARERCQMGYDLHDGLLQQIIGAGMLLEALRYRIAAGHATTENDLLPIVKILQTAISEGRTLIRRLEHNELEETEHLDVLLNDQLASLQKRSDKTHFHLQLAPDIRDRLAQLPPHVIGHLNAIVREATSNILRHSKATEAHIILERSDSQNIAPQSPQSAGSIELLLTIRDNGRGMQIADEWDQEEKNHFGLASMQYRATSIGGVFSMQTEPGKGTAIQIRFPLPDTHSNAQLLTTKKLPPSPEP